MLRRELSNEWQYHGVSSMCEDGDGVRVVRGVHRAVTYRGAGRSEGSGGAPCTRLSPLSLEAGSSVATSASFVSLLACFVIAKSGKIKVRVYCTDAHDVNL